MIDGTSAVKMPEFSRDEFQKLEMTDGKKGVSSDELLQMKKSDGQPVFKDKAEADLALGLADNEVPENPEEGVDYSGNGTLNFREFQIVGSPEGLQRAVEQDTATTEDGTNTDTSAITTDSLATLEAGKKLPVGGGDEITATGEGTFVDSKGAEVQATIDESGGLALSQVTSNVTDESGSSLSITQMQEARASGESVMINGEKYTGDGNDAFLGEDGAPITLTVGNPVAGPNGGTQVTLDVS